MKVLGWVRSFLGRARRILGIAPTPSSRKGVGKAVPHNTSCVERHLDELEARRRAVLREIEDLNASSVEWHELSVPEGEQVQNEVFRAYDFGQILTLAGLKEERLRREAHELKALEDDVRSLLADVGVLIGQRRAGEAKHKLDAAFEKIAGTGNSVLRDKAASFQTRLEKLHAELAQERMARQAEERRRKEAEEKRRREERERREEEARRREEQERREQERLYSLSHQLKEDWRDFQQVLEDNDVQFLYHFTAKKNIQSIKRCGGLYSWSYLHKHDIDIPCQGGDSLSESLDEKYGLEDYVRLSFCEDHPMSFRLKQMGEDVVVLKIKSDVALLRDVVFSDMNAADKRHKHGKSLSHLRNVDFAATKKHFLRSDDPDFKPHQAEVMVRTYVPLEYIVNL